MKSFSEQFLSFFKKGGHNHDGENSTPIDITKYSESDFAPLQNRIIENINIPVNLEFPSGVTIGTTYIFDAVPPPSGLILTTGENFVNYEQVWVKATWTAPALEDGVEDIDNDNFDDTAPPAYSDQAIEYEVTLYPTSSPGEENVQRTKNTYVTFQPLEPVIEYTVEVRSVSQLGVKSNAITDTITSSVDTTAPGQVTGVSLSSGFKTALLTWTANTEADVKNSRGKYDIEFDTANTFNTGNLRQEENTGTVVSFSDLDTGTTYYARVRAVDSSGNQGTWSATVNTTPGTIGTSEVGDGSPPASSPTPTALSHFRSFFVTWTPVTNDDKVTYEVHMSTTTGFTPSGATLVGEIDGSFATIETEADGSDIEYDTTYYFKIIAKDVDGSASASTQDSAQVDKITTGDTDGTIGGSDGSPPASSPTPTVLSHFRSFYVVWTPVANADIVTYEVHMSTSSGFTPSGATLAGEVSGSFANIDKEPDDTDIEYATTYYFKIIAKDADGSAAASAQDSGQVDQIGVGDTDGSIGTSDGNPPASSPTPSLTGGPNYILAEWDPVSNADIVTYEVHVSQTTGFTPGAGTLCGETAGTFYFITLEGDGTPLAYGTTYYCKLIAKDADGSASAGTQDSGAMVQIQTADLVDTAVTEAKLASLSVSLAKLQTDSVDTSKIVNDAITNAKIGNNAVDTAELVNDAITSAKISAGALDDLTHYASTIRPVAIVGALPTLPNASYPSGSTVILTTDSKLYRNNAGTWTTAVPTVDLTGTIAEAQIADNAVTTNKIANDAITNAKVANNAIDTAEIVTDAITNAKIANNAVDTAEIVADAITSAKIAAGALDDLGHYASSIRPVVIVGTLPTLPDSSYPDGSTVTLTTDGKLYRNNSGTWTAAVPTVDLTGTIVEAQIADNAVTTNKIVADAITNAKIANNAVDTAELVNDAITSAKISAGSLDDLTHYASSLRPVAIVGVLPTLPDSNYPSGSTVTLTTDGDLYRNDAGTWTNAVATSALTGTITETQIADDSISTAKIQANAVTASEIAANTITSNEIFANTITAGQIATGAINTDELAANAVTAGKIAADTITAAEIAANAITSDEILAGAITTAKINTGAVTSNEIAANTIVAGDIASNTITSAEIAANTITSSEIFANTITAAEIATGAINTDELAANAVTAAKIQANTITASEIAANAITSDEILAGAVTTAKINAGAVTANEIATGTITALQIASGAIETDELAANSVTANKLLVTVGGDNLIYDSSFEANNDAWAAYSGGSIARNNTEFKHGSWSLKITSNGTASAGAEIDIPAELEVGDIYTFSVWVKGDGTSNGETLRLQLQEQSVATNSSVFDTTATTGWQRLSVTHTITSASNTELACFVLLQNADNLDTIYIDQVQLEEGDVPTAWKPQASEILPGTIVADMIAANTITSSQIAANTITSNEIFGNTITAGQIASGAIGTDELAANSVTAGKIAVNTITANEIAANAITADEILANAVTTAKINTGAVTSNEIAANTIVAGDIAAGTITSTEIAAGTIVAGDIATDTITANQIASGAIDTLELAAGAVTAAKIEALTITSAEIAANTITAGQIAALTITGAEIAGTTITGDKIVALSIDTGQIAADAITTAKIDAGAVTATEIAANTITAGQIAGNTITASEIFGNTITANEINTGAITVDELATNAVTTIKVNAEAITAAKIATNTITATQIAANTITSSEIFANTITAAEIASGTITTTEIAANTIVAGDIAADTITASQIAGSTITAAEIATDTITANQIASNAITANELNANAVTAQKLATIELTASKYISSTTYTPGSAGWKILADGNAEFNNVTVRGTLDGSSITGTNILTVGADLLKSNNYATGSAGWAIMGDGSAEFSDVTVRGTVDASDIIAGSLQRDTTNLCSNGTFDVDISGWTSDDPTDLVITRANTGEAGPPPVRSGSGSLRINPGASVTPLDGVYTTISGLTSGNCYEFSLWVYNVTPADSGGNDIIISVDTDGGNNSYVPMVWNLTHEDAFYKYTFLTVAEGTSMNLKISSTWASNTANMYVDDVGVYKTNIVEDSLYVGSKIWAVDDINSGVAIMGTQDGNANNAVFGHRSWGVRASKQFGFLQRNNGTVVIAGKSGLSDNAIRLGADNNATEGILVGDDFVGIGSATLWMPGLSSGAGTHYLKWNSGGGFGAVTVSTSTIDLKREIIGLDEIKDSSVIYDIHPRAWKSEAAWDRLNGGTDDPDRWYKGFVVEELAAIDEDLVYIDSSTGEYTAPDETALIAYLVLEMQKLNNKVLELEGASAHERLPAKLKRGSGQSESWEYRMALLSLSEDGQRLLDLMNTYKNGKENKEDKFIATPELFFENRDPNWKNKGLDDII